MNRGSSYLMPSKIFLAVSIAIGIRHSTFHMLDYVSLQTFFLTSFFKSIYVFT